MPGMRFFACESLENRLGQKPLFLAESPEWASKKLQNSLKESQTIPTCCQAILGKLLTASLPIAQVWLYCTITQTVATLLGVGSPISRNLDL